MDVRKEILERKIIAIIRGASPGDVLLIAEALYEGGINMVEVTLNSPEPLKAIRALREKWKDTMLVGAGTVLDARSANESIEAGAQFILSPTLDPGTIVATKARGITSIPGAFTPTEVLAAYRMGADIVKVFPASAGPAYFKDLRGPLPQIPLMATGGVNLSNIRGFLHAGAAAFGIGGALVDTSLPVTPEYLQEITGKAHLFKEAIQP